METLANYLSGANTTFVFSIRLVDGSDYQFQRDFKLLNTSLVLQLIVIILFSITLIVMHKYKNNFDNEARFRSFVLLLCNITFLVMIIMYALVLSSVAHIIRINNYGFKRGAQMVSRNDTQICGNCRNNFECFELMIDLFHESNKTQIVVTEINEYQNSVDVVAILIPVVTLIILAYASFRFYSQKNRKRVNFN
jgi:heme/copper-type cytochrome/quinol oxidase subunit 2